MNPELKGLEKFIAPAITFGVAVLIGLIIQTFVNTRLRKMVEKTHWKGDNVIVEGLRGKIIIWAIIIGLYAALPMLHLSPEYHAIAQKALLVLVILSVTFAASSIVSGFIGIYSSEVKGEIFATSIFSILAKIVVMSIGVMIILQTLNISITPLLTALGVGGLAVALALQDTLSNLFAGLNILLAGKLKVGDYVKLENNQEGYITDITWRSTTIRQLSNNFIIIPNSKLATTITTNYHLPETEMSVIVQMGVAYDSDLEKVERVTIEVAREAERVVEGGIAEFEPFIRYHTFSDSSINFSVILRVREYVNQYLIKHEFIKMIQKRYREEGIVIPFPIRTLDLPAGSKISLEKE